MHERIREQLRILADAAKYDVSCSTSGSDRKNTGKGIGNTGFCHPYTEKTRQFNFRQADDYVLQSVSVQKGKLIKLSLYNPNFKAAPYFYNSSIYFYPYGIF